MSLTHEQVAQLLRPINPRRVSKKDNLSHLEAYDVRAHLTRIFGFGNWSVETVDLAMLYEQSKDENGLRWRAAYRATVQLTIHATSAVYTGAAVGTNMGWLPDSKRDETHDMAIKTAESQALKRCATNLGDQFGLSLYNKGAEGALVGRTLVVPERPVIDASLPAPHPDEYVPGVDSHVTELAPEAPQPDTNTPPVVPVDDGVDHVQAIRDAVVAAAADESLTPTKRKTFLLAQLAEIGKYRIGTAPVQDAAGKGISLERLTMDALQEKAA